MTAGGLAHAVGEDDPAQLLDERDAGLVRAVGERYVHKQGTFPARITRVEVATGRREVWRELAPADPAGVTFVRPILTRDARAYVYTYHRYLSDLYLVSGLR